MNKSITLNQLESYLWESADFLRSNIDAGEYKQYIFPLLFFKRLCDVHDEEHEKAVEEYGENIILFDEDALYSFTIPEGCHWNDVRSTPVDVGTAIVNAFKGIESANAEKGLEGVFGDGAWTNKHKLSDELLKNLLEHFSKYTLSLANCPEDELGNAYEYLIKKFADDSGHTAQEFYTNRTVVHLMTELLDPQPGESVYDPTCGTAGMLISCIAYLKAHGKEWRNIKIYGQEITALTSCISRINLILHGIKDYQIANDDTLESPAFTEGNELKTFDICLANPPYSIKTWNREAFSADKYGRNFLGTPPQGRADYAFIQHILKSLSSGKGRCAILLPHGVLNRIEEAAMRKELIKRDLLECVIGVGKNLFYNSPMEACIMICRTQKQTDRIGKVLFIDGRKLVTRKNNESYLTDDQIRIISDIYHQFITKPEISCIVTNEEIIKHDSSLSVIRYVLHESEEESIDINEMFAEWKEVSFALRDSACGILSALEVDCCEPS